MSIAEIICEPGKVWVSEGAVTPPYSGHPQSPRRQQRNQFYPKWGMTFKGVMTKGTIKPDKVTRWPAVPGPGPHPVPHPSPSPQVQPRDRDFKVVRFDIDIAGMAHTDPESGLPSVFDASYQTIYQKTDFYECGEYLVSHPILVKLDVDGEMETLAVSHVVELYSEYDGTEMKTRMVQRTYWSDGYNGVYCCG